MLLLRHEYATAPIQSTTPRLHQHGTIQLEFSVNQHEYFESAKGLLAFADQYWWRDLHRVGNIVSTLPTAPISATNMSTLRSHTQKTGRLADLIGTLRIYCAEFRIIPGFCVAHRFRTPRGSVFAGIRLLILSEGWKSMKSTLKKEKSCHLGIEMIASWTEVLECGVPGRWAMSWTWLQCRQCESGNLPTGL
jgi:hypothetical protein